MPYIEKEPEKIFYTIGEIAKILDVNTSLIRFWEKEFTIIKPKKNKKGNRLFSPQDLENIKQIYHLVKEKGYTLDGAKKELSMLKPSEDHILLLKLQNIKQQLIDISSKLP